MSNSRFYTYLHTRNDTGVAFYVGKGRGNRCNQKNGRNKHWKNIVAKHGYTVHIVAHWDTEVEAFKHEKLLITQFKASGICLANMTDGGEGVCGRACKEETRVKLRLAALGNTYGVGHKPSAEKIERSRVRMSGNKYRIGIAHSPEVCASISAKLKGKIVSDETRAKLSKALKGRVMTPEWIAKMSATKTGMKLKHTTEWLLRKRNGDQFRHSEETKAKMSLDRIGNQYARGHKDTPEQRENKSIAQIKRNAAINSTAKLSEKDVMDIRCSTVQPKKIAMQYGVSDVLIYRILQRKAWKHVA